MLNLWKKTLRYLPNLLIMEAGIHKRIIYGKVKPKLIVIAELAFLHNIK